MFLLHTVWCFFDRRTTLKIGGSTLFILLLGVGLWWPIGGPRVRYGQFSPSTEQVIGTLKVPRSLPARKWHADLDSLSQILRKRLIYVDDAYGVRRLGRRVDSLTRLVPTQTRDQRILSVAHLLSAPGPGTRHVGRSFVQRPINWTLLPVRIFQFDDGQSVVDAPADGLVGHEVLDWGHPDRFGRSSA